MPWIAAGASLLGGYMQERRLKVPPILLLMHELKAAQLATEEARFRPVGVTISIRSIQFPV